MMTLWTRTVRWIQALWPFKAKAHPLAGDLFQAPPTMLGTGQDWAKTVYAEYYARSVPVYAAVKLRADAAVKPPLIAYRNLANGEREPLPSTHPLQMLLDKANSWWTRGDVIRATSTYLDLWGSAFWVMDKTGPTGVPTEIWPVRSDRMSILPSEEGYIAGFVWHNGRRRRVLRTDEVIWFRYFNPLDELSGLSPMAVGRLSVDMGIEALKYNRNRFSHELLMGQLAIHSTDGITDEQATELRARLKAKYAGTANSNEPLILGGGWDAKNLGFSPREMEHLQTLRWTVEDVSRIYSVPKVLLGDLERATYSNIDAAERIFWRSVSAHLAFMAEEVTEMLAPMFGADLYVEFDLSDVEALQEDQGQMAQRQAQDVAAGILTINEVRAERNLDPVPWGDTWWSPINLAPADEERPDGNAPNEEMMAYKRWKPAELTNTKVETLLVGHGKRLDRQQTNFEGMQRQLFERQKVDVLRRLRGAGSKRRLDTAVTRQGMGEVLFDPIEWRESFRESGVPLYASALSESAQAEVLDFGLGVAFDVNASVTQDWIRQRALFWADAVNEGTADLLVSEVADAVANGESVRAIQDRVERVFAFNDTVRSERIARTEVQNAVNEGALQAYKQSGVVSRKRWITAMDGRERDAHREANGQEVPLEAQFYVGGEYLEHPGSGSAGNAINCRCRQAPVVQRAQRGTDASSTTALAPVVEANGKGKTVHVRKSVVRDANGRPIAVDEWHEEGNH